MNVHVMNKIIFLKLIIGINNLPEELNPQIIRREIEVSWEASSHEILHELTLTPIVLPYPIPVPIFFLYEYRNAWATLEIGDPVLRDHCEVSCHNSFALVFHHLLEDLRVLQRGVVMHLKTGKLLQMRLLSVVYAKVKIHFKYIINA